MQVCYSWWVLSSLTMIDRVHWIDKEKLVKFILECQVNSNQIAAFTWYYLYVACGFFFNFIMENVMCLSCWANFDHCWGLQDTENGGISDRPDDAVDVYHTYFGIAGKWLYIAPTICLREPFFTYLHVPARLSYNLLGACSLNFAGSEVSSLRIILENFTSCISVSDSPPNHFRTFTSWICGCEAYRPSLCFTSWCGKQNLLWPVLNASLDTYWLSHLFYMIRGYFLTAISSHVWEPCCLLRFIVISYIGLDLNSWLCCGLSNPNVSRWTYCGSHTTDTCSSWLWFLFFELNSFLSFQIHVLKKDVLLADIYQLVTLWEDSK